MSLPFAPVKRKRVLTDRELFAVWRAAEARPDDYGIIVRLLILTGQRRGEIASLHSAYIDGDFVTLPEELAKDGHEHTYPPWQTRAKPDASSRGLARLFDSAP